MGRVINSNSPAQNRNRIIKLISSAVDILNKGQLSVEERNDLIAFIILSCIEIEKTIVSTTAPWEKRGYWVKADQFRDEWKWVGVIKTRLMQARTSSGWQKLPEEITELQRIIAAIKPSRKSAGQEFWKGAYYVLNDKKN